MKVKLFFILIAVTLLSSCATYYMTPESLQSQILRAKAAGGTYEFQCVDKDGKETVFNITHGSSIRITKKDGTSTNFVLSSVSVQDSFVTGLRSEIMGIKIKPIKISDIKKIEISH